MFELCKNYYGIIVGIITVSSILIVVIVKYTNISSNKQNYS